MAELSDVAKEGDGSMDLPPGFRFHPTDEEIITKYLSEKIMTPGFTARAMGEVDLNKCEPWELPSKAKMGEKEWYFFCQKDRKYPTGMRTNRATGLGYWKATGKDKEIYKGKDVLIGMKKTLVFYKGRAPKGEKTNWVMHEFRLEGHSIHYPNLPRLINKDEWVVCKVFHKSIGAKGDHTIDGAAGHEGSDSSPNHELNSQLVNPSFLNSEDGPSSSFAYNHQADHQAWATQQDSRLLPEAAASEVEDNHHQHLQKGGGGGGGSLLADNYYLGNGDHGSSSYFFLPPAAAAAQSNFFMLREQANLGYLHQDQQAAVMKALPADGLSTVDHKALQERYPNSYMIGSSRFDAADPYGDRRTTQNSETDDQQQQQMMRSSYHDLGSGSSSSAGQTIRFDGFWKY